MIPLLFGTLGAIVGSFLNVVVLRRSLHSLSGRSQCMSCGSQLRWYDMVPIFSWIALRGRCRSCGSAISAQYPLVEAGTAAVFALIGASPLVYEPLPALLSVLIGGTLVAIAAYDMRHTIIPDSWAYAFAGLALAYTLASGLPYGAATVAYIAAGPLAALPIATLWFVSSGRWIGLGDAKLSLGIGWLLGPVYGIGAVFFAFVIGAVISVGILMPLPHVMAALSRRGIARFRSATTPLTMKSEVPFGPFLIASCLYVWFSLLFNLPLPW